MLEKMKFISLFHDPFCTPTPSVPPTDEDALHQLGSELFRRLDDSSDDVRVLACDAIAVWIDKVRILPPITRSRH